MVFGRSSFFNGGAQITHPEMDLLEDIKAEPKIFLEPVYPTTEKLKAKFLNGRQIGRLTAALLSQLAEKDIPENLPDDLAEKLQLPNRYQAYSNIHFPKSAGEYDAALKRLKFEEFFIAQVRLNLTKINRHKNSKGVVFEKVGDLFNTFYTDHLPFELTGAQKRVIKEIRTDTAKGHQMNRLLQGDVGSGKTIVALISMLMALDNNFQACMMAPTEILAIQHYRNLLRMTEGLGLKMALLTASVKGSERKNLLRALEAGELHLLVGTHALIEDKVVLRSNNI